MGKVHYPSYNEENRAMGWLKAGFFLIFLSLLAFSADVGQERMTAFHETIVSSFDHFALPGIFTYDHNPGYWLHNLAIGKWRIGVRLPKGVIWLYEGLNQETTQTPEELVITAQVDKFKITARLFPMMVGRENMKWEGSAGLSIESEPGAELIVEFGAPGRVRIHGFGSQLPFRWQYLLQPELTLMEVKWQQKEPNIFLTSIPETTLHISVTASVPLHSSNDGIWLIGEGKGKLYMTVSFSENEERAVKIAKLDVVEEERKLREHYYRLFKSAWIKTPEKVLDEAFQCALWNLEMTWVRPWGWIESVHHWGTLYSQQHSLAADWLGQEDRSREMIMTHAKHILPNGMIPQLDTYGRARVDFGGWNQFYVWDVQHYWRMTEDRVFAREIYPILLKVIEQTFTAHDPDGNGLLGFGQQIGNQEDYISTPEDGTSPTIAGIEMLRTKAELAEALGYKEEAKKAKDITKWMEERLKKELWLKELGYFSFYRDALGVQPIEPPYHSLIWPVIYDIWDPLDSYTSLRHLKEALQGKEGEIYVSNLFPSYVNATVGSQAGGQQQPWATLAFSHIGYPEEGLKPLLWISRLVVSSPHDGAWPELGIEPTRAYFSPPAGVFLWGVIEGLFGLQVDKPKGILFIRPGIPFDWKEAELHLPKFNVRFEKKEGELRLKIYSREELGRCLRWALPVWEVKEVLHNNKPVSFKIQPLVNRILLICDVPPVKNSEFVIRFKSIKWKLQAPAEAVEGGRSRVKLEGGEMLGIVDRQGILESWKIRGKNELEIHYSSRIIDIGEKYGKIGRKLFTHRTFFIYSKVGQVQFFAPVDLTVLPPVDMEAKEEKLPNGSFAVTIHLKNNYLEEIKGKAELKIGFDEEGNPIIKRSITVNLKPKGEQIFLLSLRPTHSLLPGDNRLILSLPNGKVINTSIRLSSLFEEFPISLEKIIPLPLPKEALRSDEEWWNFRWWSAYGHPPWNALRPPLEGIEDTISVQSLGGIMFTIQKRKLAVVSWSLNQPFLNLEIKKEARKLFLLIVPFLDHQDAYSIVGRITALCGDGAVIRKELCFPGDLDWWGPPSIIGDFATLGKGWSSSISVETPSAILNVVEMDLGRRRYVERIILETFGRYPALGLISISAVQ